MRKSQLKRITYYPKCMVTKLHRKEHVKFGLNAFETVTFNVRKRSRQPKKFKNFELQQLYPNDRYI